MIDTMNEITALTNLDYSYIIISVFVILVGIKAIVSLLEWIINKLGLETKWMRKRREEHDLLIKTSQSLTALHEKHNHDVEQSIIHDDRIRNELSEFMADIKNSIAQTQNEIKEFADNRVHDREQSIEIQKVLTESIKAITARGLEQDKCIEALTRGNKEVLGNIINERYQKYLRLHGIPSDEIDEFTNIHSAYKALNGNHNGDLKYNYVINHLPVIPVETKLITENSSIPLNE